QTFVGALPRHDLFERKPEIFAFVAVEFDIERFAAFLFYTKREFGFARRLESKIEIIADVAAIYTHDPVVRFQLKLFAETVRCDLRNYHARTPELRYGRCDGKFVHKNIVREMRKRHKKASCFSRPSRTPKLP